MKHKKGTILGSDMKSVVKIISSNYEGYYFEWIKYNERFADDLTGKDWAGISFFDGWEVSPIYGSPLYLAMSEEEND